MYIVSKPGTSRIALLSLAILFSFSSAVSAQQKKRFTINGTVVDSKTLKPLDYANVFLANTTMGTASNTSGRFTIKYVPAGDYTLTVSMIGYKTVTRQITIGSGLDNKYTFLLVEQPLSAPMITVTGKEDKDWQSLYNEVKPLMLGTTANAAFCEIENPYVLNIKRIQNNEALEVTAQKPLTIINKALGYKIVLHLDTLVFDKRIHQFDISLAFFIPLAPEDEKQRRLWHIHREAAYLGSMQHFFQALRDRRLKEEGFTFLMLQGSPFEQFGLRRQPKPIFIEAILDYPHDGSPTVADFPEWSKIIHRSGGSYYEDFTGKAIDGDSAYVSYLHTVEGSRKFLVSGLMAQKPLQHYGRWAFERLADMVPFDYQPPAHHEEPESENKMVQAVRNIKNALTVAEANPGRATELFYDGLSVIGNDPIADTLYYDIVDILDTEEMRSFGGTENRGRSLLTFWQSRDPSPATAENEYIAEHYKRLAFARRRYSASVPRGYDDRGEIYVRYGPPDLVERNPSGKYVYPNECWVYWIGKGVWFDFVAQGGMYERVIGYAPSEITPLGMSGEVKDYNYIAEFAEQRAFVSPHYFNLYLATKNIYDEEVEAPKHIKRKLASDLAKLYGHLQYESLIRQAPLPHYTVNMERPGKALKAAVSYARFLREDTTRVEIYFAVPFTDVCKPEAPAVTLRAAYTMREASGAVTDQDDVYLIVAPDSADSDRLEMFRGQVNAAVPAEAGELAVELICPEAQKTAQTVTAVEPLNTDGNDLLISDLQFSDLIEPVNDDTRSSVSTKGGVYIRPSPCVTISSDSKFWVYCEVYRLLMGQSGATSFNVSWTISRKKSLLARLNPFSWNRAALGSSFMMQGTGTSDKICYSIDLNNLEPGEYVYTIEVKDKLANNDVKRSREFTVSK